MAERVNVQVRVDCEVWESFQSFVIETHGQKYGNLGREAENALSEYIDRDRFARVEERLEGIEAQLENLGATHAHKQSETIEKAEKVVGILESREQIVIPDEVVRRAIEDVAGADDRTIQKYQGILRRRGMAWEHPNDSVWTLQRDAWIRWAVDYVNNNPTVERTDVIEGYPIGYDEIEELAIEVMGE